MKGASKLVYILSTRLCVFWGVFASQSLTRVYVSTCVCSLERSFFLNGLVFALQCLHQHVLVVFQ